MFFSYGEGQTVLVRSVVFSRIKFLSVGQIARLRGQWNLVLVKVVTPPVFWVTVNSRLKPSPVKVSNKVSDSQSSLNRLDLISAIFLGRIRCWKTEELWDFKQSWMVLMVRHRLCHMEQNMLLEIKCWSFFESDLVSNFRCGLISVQQISHRFQLIKRSLSVMNTFHNYSF